MKFEKFYVCTNCRKEVKGLNDLYFIEESSQKGFCGELCIEKYYLPVVERLEEKDTKIKKECDLHSGDFDHLNNNNEIVELVFSDPDEVFFQNNELGEIYYFFHKKFDDGYSGICICHMYNKEPSFIYLCSVTDSPKVIEFYKTEKKAKINRETEYSDFSKEFLELIEQKKSLHLAKVIGVRKEDDIPFEKYPEYQPYLSKTMSQPDEIYELRDSDGDCFYSYIKTFEKDNQSFYYISLCIKDPTKKGTEQGETVFPVVSLPTLDTNLYKAFKSETVISRAIKN